MLKGSQAAEGNSAEIFDGNVNGDTLFWKVSITNPMPMTLEFSGTILGDSVGGTVVLGAFGSYLVFWHARWRLIKSRVLVTCKVWVPNRPGATASLAAWQMVTAVT